MKNIKTMKEFLNESKNDFLSNENLKDSKFYFMIRRTPITEKVIEKTLLKANNFIQNRKLNKKKFIDEIVLFIARIIRNYDYLPSDKILDVEFDHFITNGFEYK